MGYGVVPVGGDSLPISLTSVTLNPGLSRPLLNFSERRLLDIS